MIDLVSLFVLFVGQQNSLSLLLEYKVCVSRQDTKNNLGDAYFDSCRPTTKTIVALVIYT